MDSFGTLMAILVSVVGYYFLFKYVIIPGFRYLGKNPNIVAGGVRVIGGLFGRR